MNIQETVGIDLSKKTFDAYLHVCGEHRQFNNNNKGFASLIGWIKKTTKLEFGEVLICFEHTGLYSLPMACYLSEKHISFAMVPALQIKKSLGIVRGKNDKVDARRIAEYAYLRKDITKPYILPSKSVLKLQKLISLRERMVRQKGGYVASLKEIKLFLHKKDNKQLFLTQERIIDQLTREIKKIDEEINKTIDEDDQMNHLSKLLSSIKGIGPVLIANLLVTTNCFTSFTDGRKYACYAGVAPFEKQSGTSLRSKSRVSQLANKNMKSLFNLAASSAIQSDQELKTYYHRRVGEGKSKMSTLNIIRNKLIHRVFAVVKRGTPYIPLYQHVF